MAKTRKAPKGGPAKRVPEAPTISVREGVLRWTLPADEGLEPILGSAYLLTDRAWARLDGTKRRVTVTLKPKRPASGEELRDLADLWVRELETQKLRWAVARNNRPVREYVAEQAVMSANGRLPDEGGAAGEELAPEQKAEIDRLIAEVEVEIQEIKAKKGLKDPKGISASWEEKHST